MKEELKDVALTASTTLKLNRTINEELMKLRETLLIMILRMWNH